MLQICNIGEEFAAPTRGGVGGFPIIMIGNYFAACGGVVCPPTVYTDVNGLWCKIQGAQRSRGW
jgi:hypothetical protein